MRTPAIEKLRGEDPDTVFAVKIARDVVPARLSDVRYQPRGWPDFAITLPDDLDFDVRVRVEKRLAHPSRGGRITPGMVQMSWDAWERLHAEDRAREAERVARRERIRRALGGLRVDPDQDPDGSGADLGDTLAQEFDTAGQMHYYAEWSGPRLSWAEFDGVVRRIIETAALAEQLSDPGASRVYDASYIESVSAAIDAAADAHGPHELQGA